MRRTTFGTESAGYNDWSGYISPGEIGIARNLPARQINRIETGTHLLHRLIAGERAQRIHKRLFVQVVPELLRAQSREAVLDVARCRAAFQPRQQGKDATRRPSADSLSSHVAARRPGQRVLIHGVSLASTVKGAQHTQRPARI